jgi:glutamate formiminotransferase
VLECVVNVSEGRDHELIAHLAAAAGHGLLDVHTDPDHHRSVFTLLGEVAPRALARAAIEAIDLGGHRGAHPRIGAVDVVPFVPLGSATLDDAIGARDRFARWATEEFGVPCFLYGPERTLPEIRREAFQTLWPIDAPPHPHPTAGAIAVGARRVLVAYNVWLATSDRAQAQQIARALRGPAVRALGLQVGDEVQVSMNLVAPDRVGPAEVVNLIAAHAAVARTELVGLVPKAVMDATPEARWAELDLDPSRTIEARIDRARQA